MKIEDFIVQNNIGIFVKADIRNKIFDIKKMDIELESYDLFNQLVLMGSVEGLVESVTGQLMPRMWRQGNTRCVICQPNEELLILLFYDSEMDVAEDYTFTKQLDLQLKKMN